MYISHYILNTRRLGIQIYKIPQSKLLYYFKRIGHQRPASLIPKFDEFTNPPRNILFHESGIVPTYSSRATKPHPHYPQASSTRGTYGKKEEETRHHQQKFKMKGNTIAMEKYLKKEILKQQTLNMAVKGKGVDRNSRYSNK
jgi:hypothetical protein